jgi:hypothetical protein
MPDAAARHGCWPSTSIRGFVMQIRQQVQGRSRPTEAGMSASSVATRQSFSGGAEWLLLYFSAVRAANLIRRSRCEASDLRFLVGVAGFEPTASSPELRAGRSIGVISAGRQPVADVVGRCWSAALLYFAAVQLAGRAGLGLAMDR